MYKPSFQLNFIESEKGKDVAKNKKTSVTSAQNIDITIAPLDLNEYICIIDMTKVKYGESRAAERKAMD